MATQAHNRYPHAFSPVTIGRLEMRNRLFVPAHTTNFGRRNLPSERHLAYHRARARGGASLIIFEGIRVHRTSLGREQGVNAYDPACIDAFAPIAQAVQAEGARLFGQIIHLGRHIDGNYTRTPSWGPSPISWSALTPIPHAMTTCEIAEVVEGHVRCARHLLQAGMDGIEIHLGHGHLLQEFMSPATNHRDDAYGGSEENRLRFAVETMQAVRAEIGDAVPLGIRISADEFLEGGLTLDDMCRIVPQLARTVALEFVNVSHSAYVGTYSISTQMADMSFAPDTFRYLTRDMRKALAPLSPTPALLSVCRYRNVGEAEAALAEGIADMVGMARAHIADPDLVRKAREGREEQTRPCIGCNQGCAGFLALSQPITCLANPAAGRETDWPLPSEDITPRRRRVLVVGGGPAGLEAAWVAAARGHDVTLWERSERLGGQLNWLRQMPLRREFLGLLDFQLSQCERHGAVLELNRHADAGAVLDFAPEVLVIATGAKAVPAKFPGGGEGMTLQAALADPGALGDAVALIDATGDWAAAAVAEHLADLGKHVTVIAPTGTAAWKIPIYSSYALRKRLAEKHVRIMAGYGVHAFAHGETLLEDLSTGERTPCRDFDTVIAATPGEAEQGLYRQLQHRKMQERQPADEPLLKIVQAGDCQAPRTALEAVFEGHEAARGI